MLNAESNLNLNASYSRFGFFWGSAPALGAQHTTPQLSPLLLTANNPNKSGHLLFAQSYCLTVTVGVHSSNACAHSERGSAVGGGLLIHPDLFAQTHFRLFCWRYDLLSCIKPLHLRSNVQQVLNKNYCLRLFGLQP